MFSATRMADSRSAIRVADSRSATRVADSRSATTHEFVKQRLASLTICFAAGFYSFMGHSAHPTFTKNEKISASGIFRFCSRWVAELEVEKKCLHFRKLWCILIRAVTLIALKREVAALNCRFSVERMPS